MTVKDHYAGLLAQSAELQAQMIADGEALAAFTAAHNAAVDLEKLFSAVPDRPETALFHLALREYQFALLSASTAHYRHAYISSRLFMELMLGGIYFSGFELKLRKWMGNSQDIVWASIVDKDNGPFAKSFIRAFAPDFAEYGSQYLALAEASYRECSEYVHGNMNTHGDPAEPLSYKRDQLLAWNERLAAIRIAVIFAFAARYVPFLTAEQLASVEPVLTSELGDNGAVQATFAK